MVNTSLPLVCTYLRSKSLADLEAEHGVYARIDRYKFSLNYDQIEAKDSDPLSQECRGLILCTVDGHTPDRNEVIGATKVLARPMNRFFNLGQGSAAEVDLSSPDTVVYEKLDGTLCIVYFDLYKGKGEWCIATRSVPSANLPIDGFGEYTFDTLFREAFLATTGRDFTQAFNECGGDGGLTYCFELLTPNNQVVVKHSGKRVVLLTVRHNEDGGEAWHLDMYSDPLGVPVPVCHRADSIEALVAFVNSRNGNEYEGVVARQNIARQGQNGSFSRRVKIKGAGYLMASRAKTTIGASPRNLLELILLEQIDDLLPILSEEHAKMTEDMREDLRVYMHDFTEKFHKALSEVTALGPMSDHNRRKTLARSLGQNNIWMGPAMALYEGKAKSLHDWILKHKDRTNDKRFPSGFLDTLVKLIQRKV